MFPDTFLNPSRIETYERSLQGGQAPTAISISVLDVKGPASGGTDHWCMAHFILDGHHKIAAAGREQKEITLLAFIAVDHGISSEEHIEVFLNAFEKSV
jgi:hypothetical protein